MLLIKLGGSVITDKNKALTAREDVIQRLAKEIACSSEDKVIIHGGGSFGHIKASEYCLQDGLKDPEQMQGISDVQNDMRTLNKLVTEAFYSAKVPVASIPAGAIAIFNDGEVEEFPVEVFLHYLKIGITPVTFGDVVVDRTRGVCICSGDDIMLHLTKTLKADKCIFVTAVDGIFARYPPDENTTPLETVTKDTDIQFIKTSTDVTGGMKRKLDLMFDIASTGCEVMVVNGMVPGRLQNAISGNPQISTIVKGD